jgi:hypothetical protein
MMTDLINRDDALAAIDTFRRDFEQSWKVQFSADIKALPAIDPATRIEELENSLAWYQMMDAMCSDHVVELTEKLEAAEAKLTKAVEARDNYLAERNKFQFYLQRTHADWELEVAAVDALNAKLTKAVEALRKIAVADFLDVSFAQSRSAIPIARTALAELEGK